MTNEDLKDGCIASRNILRVVKWWRAVSQWPEQQLLGMMSCALALLGSRLAASTELAPLPLAQSPQQAPHLTVLLALLPLLAPAVLLYLHTARRLLRTCDLSRQRVDEIRSAMHVIHKDGGGSAWLYSASMRTLVCTELQGPALRRGGGDAGGSSSSCSRGAANAVRLRPCSARR